MPMPRYPKLTAKQREQLERIEPSIINEVVYRPASVATNTGEFCLAVYFAEERNYFSQWGSEARRGQGKDTLKH